MTRKLLGLLGSLLAWQGVGAGPSPLPYGADAQWVYKEVQGQPLALFMYKPAGWQASDRRPALVYVHGGGWTGGNPSGGVGWAKLLGARGMVVFAVQYRLAAKGGAVDPACCIEDAKSALRYVRGHARELGLDATKIAALGSSAGAHLAAACALLETFDAPADDRRVSCRPDALVLLQPVLDNGPERGFGRSSPVIQANVKAYSPAHNVRPGAPPTILFGGKQDVLAVLSRLERFTANMKQAGNACELYVYEGVHGFVNTHPARADIEAKVVAFFEKLNWLPAAGGGDRVLP